MRYSDRTPAGLFFFIGGVEYLLLTLVAETTHPDYSTSANAISDLGVGSTALLWNPTVILLGLFGLAGTYFLYRCERRKIITAFFALAGIGAVGVGLFPETTGAPHGIFALLAFLFGGLAALFVYPIVKAPLRYACVVLGIVGLVSIPLYVGDMDLGLGHGGIERMIVLPILLFEITFGGYLMTMPEPGTVRGGPGIPQGTSDTPTVR